MGSHLATTASRPHSTPARFPRQPATGATRPRSPRHWGTTDTGYAEEFSRREDFFSY